MTDPHELPADEQAIDAALEELLGPASRPHLRHGFEQRLERAIDAGSARRERSRGLRPLLGAYWVVVTLASVGIGWNLRDSLTPGPGLWISLGGAISLAFAVLSFCLLASVPTFSRHRTRSLGR